MINDVQKIMQFFGILTSISWNSNHWHDDPTGLDLRKCYKFVNLRLIINPKRVEY